MAEKSQIIVAYVPVLHEGYARFFDKHPDARELFLIGNEIIKDYKPLTKDLRALEPELMMASLTAWNRFTSIRIVGYEDIQALADSHAEIIMPDEEVMRDLKEKYFKNSHVTLDSIFLRWDKHKSFENRPIKADQTISKSVADREIISLLRKEAEKSSDVWRQIGAAVVKDGKVMNMLYNHAVPSEHLPYEEGDPRSDFSKGVSIGLSTSFHCEARLIAEAAQRGTSLEGTSLYVTTFPCPACAKLVAYSGIKKLYYADGYGVLDGERILKSRGVEIVFVEST
jgi:dCMP deaminase